MFMMFVGRFRSWDCGESGDRVDRSGPECERKPNTHPTHTHTGLPPQPPHPPHPHPPTTSLPPHPAHGLLGCSRVAVFVGFVVLVVFVCVGPWYSSTEGFNQVIRGTGAGW